MMKFADSENKKVQLSESNTKEITSSKMQVFPKYCIECGSPLELGDVFCSECGSKIQQEEVVSIEKEESIIEEKTVSISSDRMASILQTNKLKAGELSEDFTKPDLSLLINGIETEEQKAIKQLEEKTKLLAYYIHRNSYMTQYLIIENIQNDNVKASVKTTFSNGGYSTEFYEGILSGNELHLHMVDSDLHPPATELDFSDNSIKPIRYVIQVSENFDGIVNENTISGMFKGQFNNSVVFKKC